MHPFNLLYHLSSLSPSLSLFLCCLLCTSPHPAVSMASPISQGAPVKLTPQLNRSATGVPATGESNRSDRSLVHATVSVYEMDSVHSVTGPVGHISEATSVNVNTRRDSHSHGTIVGVLTSTSRCNASEWRHKSFKSKTLGSKQMSLPCKRPSLAHETVNRMTARTSLSGIFYCTTVTARKDSSGTHASGSLAAGPPASPLASNNSEINDQLFMQQQQQHHQQQHHQHHHQQQQHHQQQEAIDVSSSGKTSGQVAARVANQPDEEDESATWSAGDARVGKNFTQKRSQSLFHHRNCYQSCNINEEKADGTRENSNTATGVCTQEQDIECARRLHSSSKDALTVSSSYEGKMPPSIVTRPSDSEQGAPAAAAGQTVGTSNFEIDETTQVQNERMEEKKFCKYFKWTNWMEERAEYSLFIFQPGNKMREIFTRLTQHKRFDYFILVFITLNCFTLAMERPKIPAGSLERELLSAANYLFTVVFAFEMAMKVIALGLIYGENAYFTSGWNTMDGILVGVSLLDLFLSFIAQKSPRIFGILRVFRLLRSLRPLRFVRKRERESEREGEK